MKFSNWKEIAELLTLMAVVGGLIAVVAELRQTQAALSAQAYQARAFNAMESNWTILGDRELQALVMQFQTGATDLDSLDPADRSTLFFGISLLADPTWITSTISTSMGFSTPIFMKPQRSRR